jgi:alkanesulfonate monooxygenase
MPPRASVGMADLSFVGTPIANADQMKEWLLTNAPDGFNIMFTFLPQGLDDFVEKVVP